MPSNFSTSLNPLLKAAQILAAFPFEMSQNDKKRKIFHFLHNFAFLSLWIVVSYSYITQDRSVVESASVLAPIALFLSVLLGTFSHIFTIVKNFVMREKIIEILKEFDLLDEKVSKNYKLMLQNLKLESFYTKINKF
jgi:hypothetical protein